MIEVLKYCLPALIVLGATWIVMHKLFAQEQQKRLFELQKVTQKEISSVRLRAYERLSLLLDRTTPEHMLLEMQLQNMGIIDVQKQLLRTIRLEYDHNLSQQIYVSDELWDKIIRSRDEMGAFVNTMAAKMAPDSSSLDYAKTLITAYNTNGDTPHSIAMSALKEEARALLVNK